MYHIYIYVRHSQSVDGRAEPAILAEFGKGSVVRAMNRHSHARAFGLSGEVQEQIIMIRGSNLPTQ